MKKNVVVSEAPPLELVEEAASEIPKPQAKAVKAKGALAGGFASLAKPKRAAMAKADEGKGQSSGASMFQMPHIDQLKKMSAGQADDGASMFQMPHRDRLQKISAGEKDEGSSMFQMPHRDRLQKMSMGQAADSD